MGKRKPPAKTLGEFAFDGFFRHYVGGPSERWVNLGKTTQVKWERAAAAVVEELRRREHEINMASASVNVNLVEKHRPRTLADLAGQDGAVRQLRSFLAAPAPAAFLFEGDTGVGKTSAAVAFARELGVDVDQAEWGGLWQIASGEQDGQSVRDRIRSLHLKPMTGSGWKVLIVNEADVMTPAASVVWLFAKASQSDGLGEVVPCGNEVDSVAEGLMTSMSLPPPQLGIVYVLWKSFGPSPTEMAGLRKVFEHLYCLSAAEAWRQIKDLPYFTFGPIPLDIARTLQARCLALGLSVVIHDAPARVN